MKFDFFFFFLAKGNLIFRWFSSADLGLSMSPRYGLTAITWLCRCSWELIYHWCVFIVNMRVSCPCTWFGTLRHSTEDGVIFLILNMKIYRNSKSYLFSITRENEQLLWLNFEFLWLMVFVIADSLKVLDLPPPPRIYNF